MIIVLINGSKTLLLFIVADDYSPTLFLLVAAFFSGGYWLDSFSNETAWHSFTYEEIRIAFIN